MQPPFLGIRREQVIAQILQKDPRPPRRLNKKVPVDLETICLKAMEKDPDRRYQTAGQMADDLRRYIHRYTIAAKRSSVPARIAKLVRRKKGVVAATFALMVLGCAAAVMTFNYHNESRARNKEQTARASLPEIRSQAESGNVVAAFLLADSARRSLQNDPEFDQVWQKVSATGRISTEPIGANVLIKDWRVDSSGLILESLLLPV